MLRLVDDIVKSTNLEGDVENSKFGRDLKIFWVLKMVILQVRKKMALCVS